MKTSILKGKRVFSGVMILFMMLGLLISISIEPQSAEAAPPLSGNWTLISQASDEFDGTQLNTTKWKKGLWYDVSSQLAFKDSNVSVSGGNLVLTAKKETYNGKAYTIGAVESKFDVPGVNSYVEVRAKMLNSNANVLSAIWMQSSPLASNTNPNPEIDIQETFDFYKFESTLHTWRIQPDFHWVHGRNKWNTGVDVSQDYHTYGLERRDGKLRFYFDGVLAWETTPSEVSFVEMARHMVLSLEGHLGTPVDAYLPNSFLVDYVRTYYDISSSSLPANGTYKIINRNSGKALNVPNASIDDGTQLIQWPYAGGDHEKWVLTSNGDGTYSIKNVNSNKYLDVYESKAANGTAVIQWSYHGSSNQKWIIEPVGNGYYRILSLLSGKALCVKDASTADGAKIIQWSYGTALNDQWEIVAP